MLAGGEWRATSTAADPLTLGFHISSLYSPPGWLSWGRIARDWLTAEQLVTVKTRRGFQKLEWHKLRERNGALDCRVYARAAAWIAGADRWSERKWVEMERVHGVTAAATPIVASSDRVPQHEAADRPAHRQPGRSDWLGGRQRNWSRQSTRSSCPTCPSIGWRATLTAA